MSDAQADDTSTELTIGGEFEQLNDEISIEANDESTVLLSFDSNPKPNDWFVLTLEFDEGSRGQFFISVGGN